MASKFLKGKFLNQIPTRMNPEGTNMWSIVMKMIKGTDRKKPDKPITTRALSWENDGLKGFENIKNDNYYIWLGHSSVFLHIDGIKILIDPVFSGSTSPIPFLGPKAFEYTHSYTPEQFPDPDIILISHDHYDHLDKMAIKAFMNRTKQFIAPLRVGKILEKWGVNPGIIKELDWENSFQYSDELKITAQTSRHFSGRGLTNRNSTLWCSYIIESKSTKIFFSGDSGYGPHFKQIGEKYGPFDMAFIECGQYNENWPFIHMMPEETVQAAIDVKANSFVPIHWGKFALSLHAWDDPPKRSGKEAKKLQQEILLPDIGEATRLPEKISIGEKNVENLRFGKVV